MLRKAHSAGNACWQCNSEIAKQNKKKTEKTFAFQKHFYRDNKILNDQKCCICGTV